MRSLALLTLVCLAGHIAADSKPESNPDHGFGGPAVNHNHYHFTGQARNGPYNPYAGYGGYPGYPGGYPGAGGYGGYGGYPYPYGYAASPYGENKLLPLIIKTNFKMLDIYFLLLTKHL